MRIGITGTDTGVGKTVVASALLAALAEDGYRVAPMKPAETGVNPGEGGDAGRLLQAARSSLAVGAVSPFRYAEPCAPLVAADREGHPVLLDVLDRHLAALEHNHEVVVVEGAGGLLVPYGKDLSFLSLCVHWRMPLVVVALNRLGVLNHALLTVEAARSAGVPVSAVVLNEGRDGIADVASRTNSETLRRLLPGLPVITFPLIDGDAGGHLIPAVARAAVRSLLSTLNVPDGQGSP